MIMIFKVLFLVTETKYEYLLYEIDLKTLRVFDSLVDYDPTLIVSLLKFPYDHLFKIYISGFHCPFGDFMTNSQRFLSKHLKKAHRCFACLLPLRHILTSKYTCGHFYCFLCRFNEQEKIFYGFKELSTECPACRKHSSWLKVLSCCESPDPLRQ